jgi:hypothetical protein
MKWHIITLCLALVACGGSTTNMNRNDDLIPSRPVAASGGPKVGLVPDLGVTEGAVAQWALTPLPPNGGFERYNAGTLFPPDHWSMSNYLSSTGVWGTHVVSEFSSVHLGTNAIRFKPAGTQTSIESDFIEIYYGKKATANFWMKVNAVNATGSLINLVTGFYDKDGTALLFPDMGTWDLSALYFGSTPTGWVQFRGTGNNVLGHARASGAKYMKFIITVFDTSGTATDVTIDDFSSAWVEAQDEWTPANLQAPWVNFGGGYVPAQYMMDTMGFVHIQGQVKSGTVGSVIFNLPAGYRPKYNQQYPIMANNAFGLVSVNTNGDVKLDAATGTPFVTLNIPTFLGEQ